MTGNLRGGVLMVAAMAGFAVEDVLIKQLTATLAPAMILSILGTVGFVVFGILSALNGRSVLSLRAIQGAVGLRNLAEMIGTFSFILALALTSLSLTSAILQAAPLLVAMGAALFFGEQVGWRRWTAILIGFTGMLLILRPGLEGFQPASLFAVLGVVALAGRDLVTRGVPSDLSTLQMAAWGFVAVVPAGILLHLMGLPVAVPARLPDIAEAQRLALAFCFGGMSYYALTFALRIADISVVAPLRYSRLVFALILARMVLKETSDALTLIGAALIILSGLYTIARERALSRKQRLAQHPSHAAGEKL